MGNDMDNEPSAEHPFIGQFREAWACATLDALMAPLRDDVTLIQPMSKPIVGKLAATNEFRRVLYRLPGMRGEDISGLGQGDLVLIDWTMVVPIGAKTIRVPIVDKVLLEGGLVKKRTAYFDPTLVSRPLLRSPSSLLRHLKSQFLTSS